METKKSSLANQGLIFRPAFVPEQYLVVLKTGPNETASFQSGHVPIPGDGRGMFGAASLLNRNNLVFQSNWIQNGSPQQRCAWLLFGRTNGDVLARLYS